MHEQIGVAPDRRGEVGIRLEPEAEVAGIIRLVNRQALRAQQHRFDQACIGAFAYLLQQRGEIARRDLFDRRQAQFELAQEFEQVVVLGCRWRGMSPRPTSPRVE